MVLILVACASVSSAWSRIQTHTHTAERCNVESRTCLLSTLMETGAGFTNVGFQVAPMQCYTNLALRELLGNLSPSALKWTEMEKVADILQADAKGLQRRFGILGHKNIVLQLGSNDPALLKKCLSHLDVHGYSFDEVSLNCGCPSIESGGAASYGASLMKDPTMTARLVETLVKEYSSTDTAVSLKCRIGIYETVEDWAAATSEKPPDELTRDHLAFLHNYVKPSCDAGLSNLIVHARPAVLAGLSPAKNRQVPSLDYGVVEALAESLPIPVTLNGGIQGLSDYRKALERSSSISHLMAGRWILRRPLDLSVIEVESSGGASKEEAITLAKGGLTEYADYAIQCLEASCRGKDARFPTVPDLILPLFLTSEQLREDFEALNDENYDSNIGLVNTCRTDLWLPAEDIEDMYDCICETLTALEALMGKKPTKFSASSIEFNKVSSSMKSLVGTKVANKWKRNRAELL